MAYLGDIRENSISPEGIIWENDNRKDARYYWNGAFVDLCDLPGEDYAKTIFVTSGSGSNEPSTPSKTKNVITVQLLTYVNENNEEVWAYNAMAKQPVASDMLVELKVRDANGNEEKVELRNYKPIVGTDKPYKKLRTIYNNTKSTIDDYDVLMYRQNDWDCYNYGANEKQSKNGWEVSN
jgi:hypothetical protein